MDIAGAGIYCAAKAAIDSQLIRETLRPFHTNSNPELRINTGLSGTWHKELAPFAITVTAIQVSRQHNFRLSKCEEYIHLAYSLAWSICNLRSFLRKSKDTSAANSRL